MARSQLYESPTKIFSDWPGFSVCTKCGGDRLGVEISLGRIWCCKSDCGTGYYDAATPFPYGGRPQDEVFFQGLREVVEDVLDLSSDTTKVPIYACEQGHTALQVVGLAGGYAQLQCRNFTSIHVERSQLSKTGFVVELDSTLCRMEYGIHTNTLPEGFSEALQARRGEKGDNIFA